MLKYENDFPNINEAANFLTDTFSSKMEVS